ncbi:MAG: efflux transporter outer membrane subunit [Syntrophorhabdales bacterium]|jgi:multidrug efflux system outer membrane protein
MRRNALIVILAVGCLAGCTMIPRYSRPSPPIPAQWPTGPAFDAAYEGQAGPPQGQWRDFYLDDRLQKVIELALNNNRDMRAAALNIERARNLYRIQRAELFPEVDASGGVIREKVPFFLSPTGKAATLGYYDVNLGVSSWEIDFFGRLRSLKESALEQYLATWQALRSARISLMAEVASAYLAYAADRENLKLAQLTLAARQGTVNLVRRRFEAGASSALDLRQAETAMEAAQVDVAGYTRSVALDENALNLLVGTTAPPEFLPEDLSAVTPPRDFSPGLTSEQLLRRPDILEAENQLKSFNANIGAARAALFPRIALTTSIGTGSLELSGLFGAGSGAWTFAPQITLPIFDAGTRWASLKVAKTDRDISLAQYEKAIQTAFREAADALAQRGTLGNQIAAQESLVEASAATYRLSSARYLKGVDTYLTVLDAQRSLYAAQQGLIALRLARLTNLVTLYKVLGGG